MHRERAGLQIDFLGEKKAPLLIIDNGSSSIGHLREAAIGSDLFAIDEETNYPGLRAPLPREYVISCVKSLLPSLYRIFKIPKSLKPYPRDNYFSLITLADSDLTLSQSTPHFDTNSPYTISIIHYLNEGEYGSTGFFRHKMTGFEFVDTERRAEYLGAVESHLFGVRNEEIGYCGSNHSEFEMYKSVQYKANRMMLFQGYMLHSTLINRATDICSSPKDGRLTANIFIDFR